MDCAGCAAKIDTAVRRIPGVADVAVSATAGTMTVQHADAGNSESIEAAIRRLGYAIDKQRVTGGGGNAVDPVTTAVNCSTTIVRRVRDLGGTPRRVV
jgi:copper chaperone CopZ